MSQEVSEERRTLHGEYRKDLLARQLSNSENFDRSILSLSSGILAVSVAFVRGSTAPQALQHTALLSTSWVAFAVAIVFTLASFVTSQKAIEKHLEFAAQYYLQNQDDALGRNSGFRTATSWLGGLAGISFVVGIGFTIAFAILNLR